jgi:putative ABC transport system permease protein
MEKGIRDNINSLGSDVLFTQKWPWVMGGDYPWWKYINRPEPDLSDLKEIQKRSMAAQAVVFVSGLSKTVKYRDNSIENTGINIISQGYEEVKSIEVQDGRFISPSEFQSGRNICVIGSGIATNLFPMEQPVGRKIKLFGRQVEVIGVLKKEGNDMFGNSTDNNIYIPVNFARNFVDFRNVGATIMVKAMPGVPLEELKDELAGILRSVHRLKPRAEDDFALNQTDIISKGFDSLFKVIAWVGWIIGGFSLLVGGFGIANIMFVSVKERTGIIGIQKSLGAKNYFILLQFLFEAIFLSLLGGIFGLIIVYILSFGVSRIFDLNMLLTQSNIMLGLSVSAFIGLVSGFIPAWSASRLNPVEAMRSTF